jgi:hypothetical protein
MPRATQDFSAIDPTTLETSTFTFDFSAFLGTGETIATVAWSLAAMNGIDSAPSSRLIGSPQILAGTKVLQQIGTCIAGETYLVTATVMTSAAQTLTLYAYLPCIAPSRSP